jgi:hypothetical protein
MDEHAYYAIESLRVDADQSADPNDYPLFGLDDRVGSVLHAYLRCYLDSSLLPTSEGVRAPRISLEIPEAFELVRNPTKADLIRWSTAQGFTLGCRGNIDVWVRN